jgi:hypothetical protein
MSAAVAGGIFSRYERPFIAALLLRALQKVMETEERVFRMTDGQWLQTVSLLTGEAPPDWRQLRRIKARFITRRRGTRWERAGKWELLREVLRGTRAEGAATGIPSQYRLTGLGQAFDLLLADGESLQLLQDNQARMSPDPDDWVDPDEAVSLASEDTREAGDGPGAS